MNNNQKIFSAISTFAALAVLSVLVWALFKYPAEQFGGQRLVRDEIAVLPYFGVYFKPVTMVVIFAFICWASALETLRDHATRLPSYLNRLLFISFGLVAFVFGYEVLWNFFMWTAAHILDPNTPVDFLYNILNPSMTEGKDFAYVTKVDTLYVAVSFYSMYFLHTVMNGKKDLDRLKQDTV